MSLFSTATQNLHQSGFAWHLLGMVHLQQRDYSSCARAMEQTFQTENQHVLSRFILLVCLVEDQQWEEALAVAENGPKQSLTKEYIQYWIKAADGVGNVERANELRRLLQ